MRNSNCSSSAATSLAALDALVAGSSDPATALYRYRVAVVGVWLGVLNEESARARRGAAVRSRALLPSGSHAEMAWLDGLLAVALRDTSALAVARRALRLADSASAPFLDRSLNAFQLHLADNDGAAADSLVTLERERAENGWARWRSDGHPFLTAVDRLAAARWLAKRGHHAEAARLLTWFEGVPHPQSLTRQANTMVEGLAYLERAREAEALEHGGLARDYYRNFLAFYETPAPAQQHLVDEARQALRRLGK